MHTLREHILPKRFIKQRDDALLNMCRWKKVLHIWATDTPLTEDRYKKWELLFALVQDIAWEQLWIDIDSEAIQYLSKQWYNNILQADMNTLGSITFEPDIILFTDTLEHVTNTEIALKNLQSVMTNSTQLIITVPNALCIKNIAWSIGRSLNEHPDHSLSFTYQTLYQLLEKCWFTQIHWSFCNYQYSTLDNTVMRKIVSWLYRVAISLNHSVARTLYFVIKK